MPIDPVSGRVSALKAAVIGAGYVGTCLAVALAERGAEVVAIDSDESLVADLRAGRCRLPEPGLAAAVADLSATGRLTASSSYEVVAGVDVVLVTVGTPTDPRGEMVADQLVAACEQLSGYLRAGQLVIVKSTVSPGTTRTLVAPLLERGGLVRECDFWLAFCPERLAEGAALAQVRSLPVVVGGVGPRSAAAAERFWRSSLGVEVHQVPSAEAAEVVKLATNWWIDANVAVANELARYCSALDVDVLDVTGAANTLPKGSSMVNLLMPGVGVGGSCLTKDPWMAWRDGRSRGVPLRTVETARAVNDDMPRYTASLIADELLKLGLDRSDTTVTVLGAAFKSDTGDVRNTPVLGVVAALREAGFQVRIFDPLADPAQIEARFGFAPAASLTEAVAGAGCLAFLAGHRQFHDLDLSTLVTQVHRPCLFFDGRMHLTPTRIREVLRLGFAYRGIGR
ncbi:nucleotide sugar dehydrogenase [Micromonospora sediminimaris]|uniref:NDP-sugar dehydrogenase n=1 Tax=Micromonospora sediminimaris TaxID=547162 RepID=A0A9W5UTN4_9ACTN|nr:NDP-sugar dehydrogenase [Micromonospora sediminimaris]SFD50826.1 UDP-N-acetyl-D-mannosaminuronic acid dehydrogenase [Micromonospora sediminimaris]